MEEKAISDRVSRLRKYKEKKREDKQYIQKKETKIIELLKKKDLSLMTEIQKEKDSCDKRKKKKEP